MAAMASKFNFECVIQYYTDQWLQYLVSQESVRKNMAICDAFTH